MSDDEIAAILNDAGEEMPGSTRQNVAGAINAAFRTEGRMLRDDRSLVVPIELGGRPARRPSRRWAAVAGAVALAAGLVAAFVVRAGRDDRAGTADTNPNTTVTSISS